MRLKALFASMICAFGLLFSAPAIAFAEEKIGVVLMHGKGGDTKRLSALARALKKDGMLVEIRDMPWARKRIYDKTFQDSLVEIDGLVRRLQRKGAERIYVGGHSLGAVVALGYGASRRGLDGLILLAPGHLPGQRGFDRTVGPSVQKAKDLIAAGQGTQKARFGDTNQGAQSTVRVTPEIYLSWFSPTGPAATKNTAGRLPPGLEVFCVNGTQERRQTCPIVKRYMPSQINATLTSVNADHLDVPSASIPHVRQWMAQQR